MAVKVVTDSSANMKFSKAENFVSVPMCVTTADNNYKDDADLDLSAMIEDFSSYKGKSSTACPGPGDWLEAFGDSEEIMVLTITGTLSGAYNSAVNAAEIYMQDYPDRKVKVFNSLTTGPELALLTLRAKELSRQGKNLEEIYEDISEYKAHTQLAFSLASLRNFAANGRVNKALAKSVELLRIKIVGIASSEGDLEPKNKVPGEKRAIAQVWNNMKAAGYSGGKVLINHTQNEELAKRMGTLIKNEYPDCKLAISENHGLCSYYAEPGSVLVGYEHE